MTRATVASLLGALVLATTLGAQSAAEFKLVVHSANQVKTLPLDTVKRMFLKKTTTWPNGRAVAPVDQPEDSASRRAFTREVLGKTPAESAAYWNQQIFSGRALPPPTKASDDEVLSYVRDTPNAIGYVAADARIGEGVKTLAVFSKR